MNYYRTTKLSLKFATQEKKRQLAVLFKNYSATVNFYINYFWSLPTDQLHSLKPHALPKSIIDKSSTYGYTFRLRKMAAQEALGMTLSVLDHPTAKHQTKPQHNGQAISLNSNAVTLEKATKTSHFDAWIKISSLGTHHALYLPTKFHEHYHSLNNRSEKLCGHYILTPTTIQLAFEIAGNSKQEHLAIINDPDEAHTVGIDTGINALASLSDGTQFSHHTTHTPNVKSYIARIRRCKHGSNGQRRATRALKHHINHQANLVTQHCLQHHYTTVVVEKLKNITKGTRKKQSQSFNSTQRYHLSKSLRYSIARWQVRHWLTALQRHLEDHRIVFRDVEPRGTSHTCPQCGQYDRRNRPEPEKFTCQKCGYTGPCDVIAGVNIKSRYWERNARRLGLTIAPKSVLVQEPTIPVAKENNANLDFFPPRSLS
jgi:ribosomal protein L37AE/L43A